MRTRFRAAGLTLALLAPLTLGNAAHARLDAQPSQGDTLLDVVTTLQRGHYNQISIDDRLSSDLLDRYLEALDPTRSYFYAADVAEFEALRTRLDDQIIAGDLTAAYAIYNRFEERNLDRLDFMISRLEDSELSYDFSLDETIDLGREQAPWFDNREAMDNYWRKRLKNALLSLKLADKSLEEAREVLLKRYRNQKQRSEQTKSEDVFQIYVNALTGEFDPHTQYFSPQNTENFQINMSLSLEGIGAVLQSQDEMTKIVSLVPAGPAEKSGELKPADQIVGVGQGDDGEIEDVVGWRLDDVVQLIRGPKGTVVRLEIIPADALDKSMRKVVRLERNKIKLEEQAASSRILEVEKKGVIHRLGVITIPTFYIDFAALQQGDPNYRSTTRDVRTLIDELKTQNIEGLIVDLRDNGGGSLREANELVGLFISRGPTVQIRDPEGRVDILGDFDPSIAWHGPLTVVVNRLSASASEIFAGAIQDYQRGLVVGSRTFGKGTVQVLQPIDEGQLKLTHSKFYRISGESTQHKGVVPDIEMPTLYDEDEIGESALDTALPWDQVHAVRFGRYPSLHEYLPMLRTLHEQRTGQDPDFRFMRAQIAHLAQQNESSEVSLNEARLKQERLDAETWLLEMENQRRSAKGQPAVTSLAELSDSRPKDKQGRPINPEAEAILRESASITLDLIDLSHTVPNTAQGQTSS